MRESIKAVCVLMMIIGIFAGIIAWYTDQPNAITWSIRTGGPIASVLALYLLCKLQFQRDRERDYLRLVTGAYFNRDGFCFTFHIIARDGIAILEAYFQSQYDRPSHGRVALRPASGFFLTRAKIDTITFDVECPAAAFGVVRIPISVPKHRQGKQQTFEVGASVRYPDGKGRRVRFHDGIYLRANSQFGNSLNTALTAAAAATGSIALSKPATATVHLPADVFEETPAAVPAMTEILWRLGDSDLLPPAPGTRTPRQRTPASKV